jgi:NO-binding membrane sensor protein with MHYT domain
MNQLIETTYSQQLVALSFVISAVGAFAALTAAGRIIGQGRRVNVFNVVASGVALGGIGVWAMHFIGMLAVRLNMGVSYSMAETLLSLVAAVGGSAAALLWVARRPDSVARIAGAGVLLGLGVCAMHYLGMYGMRFAGYLTWSLPQVGLSVLIAIVAATAALWLSFRVRTFTGRVAASLVMAGAVCAMHYTGMAAADFICTSPDAQAYPQGFGYVPSLQLPSVVTVLALGMAVIVLVDQVFQRLGSSQNQRQVPAPGTGTAAGLPARKTVNYSRA